MNEVTQVLLYALVAGFSPLALLSILAVLSSGRGRANGSAFGTGFLFGQSLTLIVAFVLGSATVPNSDRGHPTLTAVLELLLGAAMLVFAWQGRRPREVRLEAEPPSVAQCADVAAANVEVHGDPGLGHE